MKNYIGVLTYKDPNDIFSNEPLRSTPMKFLAKNKQSAIEIMRQQAFNKFGLYQRDIVDIHVFVNNEVVIYERYI